MIRASALGLAGLVVVACTGGDAGVGRTASPVPSTPTVAPTPSAAASPDAIEIGTATLSIGGCAFDGTVSPPAGPVVLAASNDAELLGVFELLRLAGGSTWDELAEHVGEERRRAEQGEPPLNRPEWAVDIGHLELAAGDHGQIASDVEAGTHALVCALIGDPEPNPIAGIFAVGPIEVGG